MGVNLKRRFDIVFSIISSTSSNSPQLPDSQINKLFEDDSADNHMNDDSEGI